MIGTLERLVQRGIEPDLTLYLDLDPVAARERLGERELDRFEREAAEFFERVRGAYLARARRFPRFRVIDAGHALPKVQRQLASVLDEFLNGVSR